MATAADQHSVYVDKDFDDEVEAHCLSPSEQPLFAAFCEFISSSNWLYPTARFFGHALYGECIIMLSNIA